MPSPAAALGRRSGIRKILKRCSAGAGKLPDSILRDRIIPAGAGIKHGGLRIAPGSRRLQLRQCIKGLNGDLWEIIPKRAHTRWTGQNDDRFSGLKPDIPNLSKGLAEQSVLSGPKSRCAAAAQHQSHAWQGSPKQLIGHGYISGIGASGLTAGKKQILAPAFGGKMKQRRFFPIRKGHIPQPVFVMRGGKLPFVQQGMPGLHDNASDVDPHRAHMGAQTAVCTGADLPHGSVALSLMKQIRGYGNVTGQIRRGLPVLLQQQTVLYAQAAVTFGAAGGFLPCFRLGEGSR